MTTSTSTSLIRRPFAAFLALGVVFAIAFASWSVAVFGTALPEFDREVSQFFAEHGADGNWIRSVMVVATACGGIRANFALAIGGALWMWRRHRPRFAVAWLLIAMLGGLLDLGLKHSFDRPRPPRELRDAAVTQDNPSYPSGHAMGSLIGYGMVGFALGQRLKGWRRVVLALTLTAWVATIGVSRIYLRAHWFSDVVGGWLIGAAYVNLCLTIYFWRTTANRSA